MPKPSREDVCDIVPPGHDRVINIDCLSFKEDVQIRHESRVSIPLGRVGLMKDKVDLSIPINLLGGEIDFIVVIFEKF